MTPSLSEKSKGKLGVAVEKLSTTRQVNVTTFIPTAQNKEHKTVEKQLINKSQQL